jgi:hypothetical protein
MISKSTTKKYLIPTTHTLDIILHEKLLDSTIIVDPDEEGDQEDAEVNAREFIDEEERDVWSDGGLW